MKNDSGLWITVGIIALVLIVGGYWIYSANTNISSSYTPDTSNGEPSGANNTGGSTGGGTKPIAITAALASPTSSTTVVFAGTVIPGGLSTNYWFEYGTTLAFGYRVGAGSLAANAGTSAEAAYLTGLAPGKQYYFRIGAQNAKGVSYGAAYNFIMPAK